MNSLSSKFGLLLGAAFVIGTVLLLLTQMMVDEARLPELLTQVVIGAVAFGQLAALAVFQLFSRRLKKLADAVESFRAGTPLHLAGADPQGDEIDRLAAHIEQMARHIGEQLAALERVAAQRHELLANVSHDLRTPLASMQGYLEMLLLRHGSLEPAEALNYLETAARQSEHLGRLVGDLFDLTRLEEGEMRAQGEDFLPAELAHDVAQKFARDARARELRLRVDTGSGYGLHAHADIRMIERVLEHLVENALQHTPRGGEVTLQLVAGAGRARYSVHDTGCGIAPEVLASLFERYERADRRGGARVGLRLAITQRLVRLHGSELEVRSQLGKGSCFSFDLPVDAGGMPLCSPTR